MKLISKIITLVLDTIVTMDCSPLKNSKYVEDITGTEEEWNQFFDEKCPKYHLQLAMRDFGCFNSKKAFIEKLEDIIEHDEENDHPSLERGKSKLERVTKEDFDWQTINQSEIDLEIQLVAEQIYNLYNGRLD